jgi:hypothetical protein
MGQLIGLPIADGAAPAELGLLRASGGIVLGDDVNFYGGRVAFAPTDGLTVFGDLGAVDFDESGIDMGWGIQGGGQFTLPMELPVDVAVRATAGMAKSDIDGGGDVTWTSLNGGVVASKAIDMLTPYAYVGLHYLKAEAKAGGHKHSEDDTEPGLGAGVLFAVNEQISLYGEFIYIDDPYFGVGGRFRF